ncbi:MAG: hybrid sensor histidine kinase/response regulator [Cereibacter sphaeroides]|uniref:histidine kinase n=1 Tax=Cereibacter sphaeroides TaxID=1063 RepID=A0A2W5URH9_CERSP|nr:MAG: hybrid sensor histidine kinase/response regulator [Cereibacter sphaeroides]
MSLIGLDFFSAEADLQRTEMSRTLQRVAGITALLIIILSLLASVLLRLYQRSRIQALENRLTTSRLETIVTTSVDAIIVVDKEGKVLEFNPAAESIFGYSRAEAFGRLSAHLIIPPEKTAATISAIQTYLAKQNALSQQKQHIELEAMRKDGSRFMVEASVAQGQNAEGAIYVAFMRDISDRRQAERDLTEARDQALKGERAKAEFLAVMSHEMRTPLNGLLGSVDILGATTLTAPQREVLEVIETSGQVLLHHVNSVLDISSAEASAIRPDQAPFALEALVREVVANQSGLAAAGGNALEIVVVNEAVGRVVGDPARLRQILLNLVGNAVKFTRNGRITIEIEAAAAMGENRLVEIRVVDSGIGIAEADQRRVFEDFVTLDSSYGRETGGTGLGLGITQRLVTALGGTIGVESEPGQGSVFWVRLPFAQETGPVMADAADAPETIQPERRSVLIIEDNAINRFVLRSLLEEADHRVTEAVDGVEGVARAEATQHDVILMDISMPRLDGVEAAKRIRNGKGKSRKARIIAVTAHALPEELRRFYAAGIDDCLVKPVTRGALTRVLSGKSAHPAAIATEVAGLPLVDGEQLNDLLSRLDGSVAESLLRRFVAEGDDSVPRLLGCPPDPAAERLCHQLAGSAATFGARRLAATLVSLEQALRSGGPAGELQISLSELWPQTRVALAGSHPGLLALAG